MTIELDVEGMACGGCSGSVKNVIEKLEGVESVVAHHAKMDNPNKVFVEGSVEEAAVVEAIKKAGFNVVGK
eukprot:CAMPEP_0119359420 /NCGR_PEP_ID=MMETSP1334-20130426/7309_1 /TAXON_ID=127549 /ORGANISM="Calcidiscus leptoporus, Strain RCC1130" /LENGTH=70 /DNA_ID=CAMNT_0007374089 /DNA_START=72 /DNA_END=284 /DNA_ORIENTATION=-